MDGFVKEMAKKLAPKLLKDADKKLHKGMDEKFISNISLNVPREGELITIVITKHNGDPETKILLKKNELEKLVALL